MDSSSPPPLKGATSRASTPLSITGNRKPHAKSSIAQRQAPKPTTTKLTGELEEIRSIRAAWRDASATDESKKLQDLIEERKKTLAVAKKKEEAWIMKRSKDCRRFYREEYAEGKREEERKLREMNIAHFKYRREHSQRRDEEAQDSAVVRYEKYCELRRMVRATAEKRGQEHSDDRKKHYADYAAAKKLYPQRVKERHRIEREELDESQASAWRIRDAMKEERSAAQLMINDWSLMAEEDNERVRENLSEIKARRQEAVAVETRSVKREMKRIAQLKYRQRELLKVEDAERPPRVGLMRAERTQRWDLNQLFKTVVSETYLGEMTKRQVEKSRGHTTSLTPVPDSSDLFRASERSAMRSRLCEKRDKKDQLRLEEKQDRAFEFRKKRLQTIKTFTQGECDKANAFRMTSLNRRRGEKMTTETEAFHVNEGETTLTSAPPIGDYLPTHLSSLVIDIVRGKTTKDEVDLYQF